MSTQSDSLSALERASRVVRGVAPYIDGHAIDGLRWAIAREIEEAVSAAAGDVAAAAQPGTGYQLRAALMAARDVALDKSLDADEVKARVRTLIAPHVKGGK